MALAASEDPAEPAVQVVLVESEDPAELAVQVVLAGSEDPVEPAVQESPAVLVAQARGLVPVAAELELAQVVVELELAQVVVELAPGRVEVLELELVQVAVAPRTKSVTAAHHPDLVPLLAAEEDLAAAVAETTREPAATEAVIAWAAEE